VAGGVVEVGAAAVVVVVEVLVEVVVDGVTELATPVFCLLAQNLTGFTKSSSPDSEIMLSLLFSVFGWLRKYCCCAFFASISALRCAYRVRAKSEECKKGVRGVEEQRS
jgi:hypothetical protein